METIDRGGSAVQSFKRKIDWVRQLSSYSPSLSETQEEDDRRMEQLDSLRKVLFCDYVMFEFC